MPYKDPEKQKVAMREIQRNYHMRCRDNPEYIKKKIVYLQNKLKLLEETK